MKRKIHQLEITVELQDKKYSRIDSEAILLDVSSFLSGEYDERLKDSVIKVIERMKTVAEKERTDSRNKAVKDSVANRDKQFFYDHAMKQAKGRE